MIYSSLLGKNFDDDGDGDDDALNGGSLVSSLLSGFSWSLSWCLYLTAVGAALALLAALVVGIFNTPVSDNHANNALAMTTTTTTTTGYPVVVQGGHSFVSTVQGGNPYVYYGAQGPITPPAVPGLPQGANPYPFVSAGPPAAGDKDGVLPPAYASPYYAQQPSYPPTA